MFAWVFTLGLGEQVLYEAKRMSTKPMSAMKSRRNIEVTTNGSFIMVCQVLSMTGDGGGIVPVNIEKECKLDDDRRRNHSMNSGSVGEERIMIDDGESREVSKAEV